MAIETVGIRAVVDKLDQFVSGVNQMNTRTDQLLITMERLAQQSAKTNAALASQAAAYQRKAQASTQAKKADEEHLSVMQKIEKQLARNLSASIQFSGAFLIIKAQQAIFEGLSAAIVGMNARLEQSTIAFTTMLGSARAAGAFLQDLQQFAARTPFEFPELVSATQRLLAFQIAAHDVIPLLTSIGDAVAGLGSGAQGIERVTLALGQMQAKGRVSGEELRQLAEAGIPGLKILADELDVTTAQVQEMVSAGQVSSDTFIRAFQRFSELNFGGLMQKQEQTFTGSLSTIKDQLLLLTSEGFKPLFESIRDLTVSFSEFLKSNQAVTIAGRLASAFKAMSDSADVLVPILTAVAARLAALAVVGAVTWAFRAVPIISQLAFAFQLVAARAATAGEAMRLLGAQSLKALGPLGLIVIAFTALDIAISKFTGRGLTERILGIGGAASEAEKSLDRIQQRFEELSEAGVPRAEAQVIVNRETIQQLDAFVQRLDAASAANQEYVNNTKPVEIAINELAKALGFVENPVREAQQGVELFSQELIKNTRYAEDLRAAWMQFPDVENLLRPEFAERSARELETLTKQQQTLAENAPIAMRRIGTAFEELDSFVKESGESGKEWAGDLAAAIAATEGQITPDLKKLQGAFTDFFESDQSREAVQKFLESFGGGKNNPLAKLFAQMTKDAEEGTKNVMSALGNLLPETDELFTEWLSRLEQHADDMANFSNNLRFIFESLGGAATPGIKEFIKTLENAGPEVTAGVAGMVSIDPEAARRRFDPILKGMAGTMSDTLTDSIIAGEATTQETVGDSIARMITGAIARAEHPIFARLQKLGRDVQQGMTDILVASIENEQLLALIPELNDPITGRPVPRPAAPAVKPVSPTESRGALDRLAREAEAAAEKAQRDAERAQREAESAAAKAQREAEQAQREAEQAARDVAAAFEAELAIRLQTVAQTTSADFSRFFNLFIAGFNVQAAEVFDRIPPAIQRTIVELTLAEQAERKFNDSVFELGNNLNLFDVLTGKILNVNSSLDQFIRGTEDSLRAAQQVGGFENLGRLAAEAYITGLVDAEGAAGDAARRIVEAVQSQFEESITLFDNLASKIGDAIRERNDKEEEGFIDLLEAQKEALNEEVDAKKDAIDDGLEARLESLDKEKEAVKNNVDEIIDQIDRETEARLDALDKAKDSREDPEFSSEGNERAINAQTQAIVDASNARIAAFEREKQAIQDLARAREEDRKVQDAQRKIQNINRLLGSGVSAGTGRLLRRQLREQQQIVQDVQDQRNARAVEQAQLAAVEAKIEAERRFQEQVKATEKAQIDHAKAVVEEQKKQYDAQKKAQDQALEDEKKRIKDAAEAEKKAIEEQAKIEQKRIEETEKAERKAAETRKEELDKANKETLENIDNQITKIREFFEEFANAPAVVNQQILDLIQGGKVDEIAALFTEAGISPFELSGLTLGQAFFTGFFSGEHNNTLDSIVAENIGLIQQGQANTAAITSGTVITQSLGGAIDAELPNQFAIATTTTIDELHALKDQAVPVAKDDGTEVGISFVDGMINGVQIQTPALERAIQEAVARGVAAAQATIDARSPSRVTERLIGLPFSQGIAVGILKGAAGIQRAAHQVISIVPSLGQPGGAMVASPRTIEAAGVASAVSAGSGAAVAGPTEVHEHYHMTVQAWDSTDVRRNSGKILRQLHESAKQGKTGPIGG